MATWRDIYLIDFLKEENARVSCGDRWLVWAVDHWIVYERPPYKKNNRCLYSGDYLSVEALEALKGE